MPSILQVTSAALAAAVFYTALGLPIARRLLPPVVAHGAAPALGWAVYSAVALPILSIAGFSAVSVLGSSAACLAAAAWFWRREPGLPPWCWVVAGVTALLPAMTIMPIHADGGVLLAPPMFDHAKVAIIDQITRQGLPVGNPFFAVAGAASRLSYYYLWHFSAAVLAEALGLGGWAADAAMTWFTGLASVMLMIGLAVQVGGRRSAAWLVALLSIPASLRPVAAWVFGAGAITAAMPPSADIGAWVNQASWVPQHLASGCCVVLAALLIAGLPDAGWLAVPVLGLVVASGFESSTWVGGVTFAAASLLVAPVILLALPRASIPRFLVRAAGAAVVAGAIVAPFLISQLQSVASRNVGFPVALQPYRAFSQAGGFADLLAFWPLVLTFDFPALLPVGAFALREALRTAGDSRFRVLVLAGFAGACLAVAWLLRSTIDNNDLGWRAPIPAILLLTSFTAGAWSRWIARPLRWPVLAAALLASLGLVQSVQKFGEALHGQRPADAAGFASSEALWASVRQLSMPGDGIANNPLMLADMTPWPDNISWALLSDRPSCYSGWATAIAYAGVSRDALVGVDALFKRVFAGAARPGDVHALAWLFDCRIAVVTAADGAWQHDPFAASPEFNPVDTASGEWRIYRRVPHRP